MKGINISIHCVQEIHDTISFLNSDVKIIRYIIFIFKYKDYFTEVAGEGGPNLAPQEFLLSQHLQSIISNMQNSKLWTGNMNILGTNIWFIDVTILKLGNLGTTSSSWIS